MEILDAWLTVIARDGWAGARLGAVATLADIDAGAAADALPDRWMALRAYGRQLDRAALAEAASDPEGSTRDRLFTMLMERFDAAQVQRPAAQELARAARRDPGLAAFFLASLPASLARIADAAGVETAGLLGPLRVQALTVQYLRVSTTWLGDDSADLAPTMKALDGALAQAEGWARMIPTRAFTGAEASRSAGDPPEG